MQASRSDNITATQFFESVLNKLNEYILKNKGSIFAKDGKLTPDGQLVKKMVEVIRDYYQLTSRVEDIFTKENLSQAKPVLLSLVDKKEPAAWKAHALFKKSVVNINRYRSRLSEGNRLQRDILQILESKLHEKILKTLGEQSAIAKELNERRSVETETANIEILHRLPKEVWLHIAMFADPGTRKQLRAVSQFFKQIASDERFWKAEVENLVGGKDKNERAENAERATMVFDEDFGRLTRHTYFQTYQRLMAEKAEKNKVDAARADTPNAGAKGPKLW